MPKQTIEYLYRKKALHERMPGTVLYDYPIRESS